MPVEKERFKEMMMLIPFILPLDKQEHIDSIDAIFGQGTTKEFPQLFKSIADMANYYPEALEGWLIWIQEAIDYALGKRNDYPEMEGAPMEKVMKIIRIRMNQDSTDAEKIKAEKKVINDDLDKFAK